MDNYLWDDFLLEFFAPGLVLGRVDIVCHSCGEITSHQFNDDGSNAYLCPACGVRNEV